MKKQVLQILIT